MKAPEREQLIKAAEALIKHSAMSESSHVPDLEEDECPGCQNMRTGLKILSLLGVENVYTA